jgi:hypothetical protein
MNNRLVDEAIEGLDPVIGNPIKHLRAYALKCDALLVEVSSRLISKGYTVNNELSIHYCEDWTCLVDKEGVYLSDEWHAILSALNINPLLILTYFGPTADHQEEFKFFIGTTDT